MATVLDALKGVNAYPIPLRTIIAAAEGRGLSLEDEATADMLHCREFNLAKADILMWLVTAPTLSQGGQYYAFSSAERTQFRNQAEVLYREFGDNEVGIPKPIYGYKGSRL